MPTNFPTSLDALVNPTATDYMDVVEHDDQHANANDAIEALQAKVGIDSSTVATSLDFRVNNPPRAQVRRTSNQTIANNTWTLLSFNTEDKDTDGLWTSGSGDRFTATRAGRYLLVVACGFAFSATGDRGLAIAEGVSAGATQRYIVLQRACSGFGTHLVCSGELVLAAGGTCSFHVIQNSGGNLDASADISTLPFRATIRWVAPD